LDKQQQKTRYF